MLRGSRLGLLSRFCVKSPQFSLNGFMSQRTVSVLNGMFYGGERGNQMLLRNYFMWVLG